MKPKNSAATVQVGANDIAIKRDGESSVSTAQILGRDKADGVEHIYLDRLIHRLGEKSFGEWNVSGAVSTILSKQA